MSIIDLLFPPLCLSCREKNYIRYGLCPDCLAQVEFTGLAGCIRCGRICSGDCPITHHYSRVLSLASYQGPWRKVVQGVKFARSRRVAVELARSLGELADGAGFSLPQVVVPAPGASRHFRNFDGVGVVAQELASMTGAPLVRALERRPGRPPQVKLNSRQRQEGLGDFVFIAKPIPKDSLVWLVDDVFTTGATADACAAKLLQAGARSVYVLVLAV